MRRFQSFLLSIFFSLPALAQERINADRPNVSQSATLTPYGYLQAEIGLGKENFDQEHYEIIYPDFLLKYGLAKKFEIQLGGDFVSSYEQEPRTTKKITGLDPISVGFRTPLWKEKNFIPKTSLLVHFGVPELASKSLKANHVAPSAILAMENTITEKMELDYNIGMGWDGFSTIPSWFYSLSSGFDVSKKWDAFLEIFGSATKKEMAQNGVDTGLGFYLNNNVKLDAYFGMGLSGAASNNFFGTGISFRFH